MNTPTPTPTPRTNAAVTLTIGADFNSVCPNFARTLEIELNAATAERDQLRAQLHALQLVCGTTDADKFSTWVDRANARAERAEAELATERAKVKLREVWLCGRTELIDCGSGQRHASDFVTFDEAEAKKHVAKYKLSWMTEGWYRAVPVRAPVAIDAAMKEDRA